MISNLHTHTYFCDGEDAPETMVLQALSEGLEVLGFSGHSYAPFDPECLGVQPASLPLYRAEIRRLQQVYGDRIRLLSGIEQDYDSPRDDLDFDYLIGSVHYMKGSGRYYAIDNTPEEFLQMVDDLYDGQALAFVRDYLDKELRMYEELKPLIVGHFDLYMKNNDVTHCIDEEDPAYLAPVQEALHELVKKDALFEVNIGGISRGRSSQPYPSVRLLRFLQKEKARLIITTDCHRASLLTKGYPETLELLRRLGFSTMTVMRKDGLHEESLCYSSI